MTPKTKKQIATGVGLFALSILVAILWWVLFGQNYLAKARESELRTNMASLVFAEEAYFEEYGEYSDNFKEIGYVPEGAMRSTLYLSAEDVPAEYKENLSEADLPFVNEDDFQILGVFKDTEGLSFWIQKSGEPMKKIKSVQAH